MDEETENNIVIEDSTREKTDKISNYKVFRGEIRGVGFLAKPDIYFPPKNSHYMKLENETEEEESIWEDKENM